MDRYRVPFFGVAVALAISLAVHARAAFDEPQCPPAPECPTLAAPVEPASTSTATAAAGGCCDDLEQCRRASWDIALKAIRGDTAQRAKRRAQADAEPPTSAADKAVAARRRALCALSEDFLRQLWSGQRDNMTAMIKDFGSEPWVENWVDFKTDELGESLELTSSQQEVVGQGYESLWKSHGPRMQRLLNREPVDHDALLRTTQQYFAEEDQMIANVLGEEARAGYSAGEQESRALIVAILGTFAGKPWDEALGW